MESCLQSYSVAGQHHYADLNFYSIFFLLSSE